MQQILEGLHPIVEMGLHKLLMDYKTDLSATITDRHKMKKLQYIDEMLKNFDDRSLSLEQKITNIKATFDKDPYIYKTESLGRFLYRCLCAWLNKPSQLVNYHMTLFKGFASEQAADEAPKSTNAYKKLN